MKQFKHTHYLRNYSVFLIFFILIVILFNLSVDPYELYNFPKIKGFNFQKPRFDQHIRWSKAVQIRRLKPAGVILGSSRSDWGIDPDHPAWPVKNVYNLSLYGTNIEEIRCYFEHAVATSPIKEVVLGLDFFTFNVYYQMYKKEFDAAYLVIKCEEGSNKIFKTGNIEALFSFNALLDSVYTIAHQNDRQVYLPNGRRNIPVHSDIRAFGGTHKVFLKMEEYFIEHTYFPEPQREFAFVSEENGLSAFESYRSILKKVYRDGIRIRMFISPIHARSTELIDALGLWSKFEEWKRQMVSINEEEAKKAGVAPFDLWDFSGYHTIATVDLPPLGDLETQLEYYVDSLHYRQKLGDLVLNRIFGLDQDDSYHDLGIKINSTNIDEHIGKIRLDKKAYQLSHPDDIAEINNLVQSSREKIFQRAHDSNFMSIYR